MPDLDHPALSNQRTQTMTKAHTRDLSAARPRGCGSIQRIKPIVPQYTPEQVELFKKLVSAQGGQVFTTSRQIAELFEKEHRNVLRAIRLLDCDEEFTALNYELTDFIDKNADSRPEYLISKDGMVFLVMGFTGKKASQFKLLYIRAFNWMMDQLHENRDLQHLLHDFARREALCLQRFFPWTRVGPATHRETSAWSRTSPAQGASTAFPCTDRD
ncbi:Rha family phage regulatory protein [Aeromonas hydrophila]|nr:Rha family phage regulatory protein [Aeromonas hydrophila]